MVEKREKTRKRRPGDDLMALANIGPATRAGLAALGVNTVAELAVQDADDLYLRLNALSGCRYDPCVWDTFAAAIHQARGGEPAPWWRWTPERKRRQAARTFCV